MEKYLSLKEHVYEYISSLISTGKLKPNERINEKELIDALDISRTPIREALITLASDGYIENVPRKGFIVKSLTKTETLNLYEVIGVLDAYCATLAAPKLTNRDYRYMKMMCDGMDSAIDAKDFTDYYDLQLKFHNIYIDKCENNELVNTITKLKRKLIRKSYALDDDDKLQKSLLITNKQHREILSLFESNNIEKLEAYIKNTHWSDEFVHLDTFDK